MALFMVWAIRLEAGIERVEISQKRILTIAEFLIGVKGIMHFRFWSKMRYELKMIKQVITDMGYFLLLVFMFIVQYTVVFFIYKDQIKKKDEKDEGLIDAFNRAINLMLAS